MFSGSESSQMMQNDPHAAITRDSELLTDGVKKSPSSTIFAGSTFGKARVSNPPIVMSQRAKVSRTAHHRVWLCGSHAILYTKIVHNFVDLCAAADLVWPGVCDVTKGWCRLCVNTPLAQC